MATAMIMAMDIIVIHVATIITITDIPIDIIVTGMTIGIGDKATWGREDTYFRPTIHECLPPQKTTFQMNT